LRQIKLDRQFKPPEFAEPFPPKIATYVVWFLACSFGLFLLADLVLAYGMLPANPDSIAYRFPRVYWYFGQGSLTHFTNDSEPRPLYYPFNGTLAYLPFLSFELGPRTFTAPSLLSWLMVGLTTYVFARDLGGSRLMAAVHSTTRAHHYEAFNGLFAPLFAWVDNGPGFSSAFYRFTGVNSPSAVVFNEQTIFIGFT
jgi:hypothetical protein